MISTATARFVRISPRKVRYVLDLIRKKSVAQAQAILNGAPRRAAGIVHKLLNSALDAAEKNSQIHPRSLFVSKLTADGGPMMKRFRAGSMGRAMVIRKRTSHIHLELDLLKGVKPEEKSALLKKAFAPKKRETEKVASQSTRKLAKA